MELASETKSLMRIMESAEYINWNLASDMEKSGFEEPDQTLLENYAKESYVTGILLLSPQGAVEQEYHTDERNVWDLYENIDAEALLDVWIKKCKTTGRQKASKKFPEWLWSVCIDLIKFFSKFCGRNRLPAKTTTQVI